MAAWRRYARKLGILALALTCVGLPAWTAPATQVRAWLDSQVNKPGKAGPSGTALLDGSRLAFSFEYGGGSSDDLLKTWKRNISTSKTNTGERRIITWDDPQSGLWVEWSIVLYKGYDAAEMRLAFQNRGSRRSEVLRNVRVLRHRIGVTPVEVIHSIGDNTRPSAFAPVVTRLGGKDSESAQFQSRQYVGSDWGWSSGRELPIWLILARGGEGLYYVLGWTGQWAAKFSASEGRVAVEAGMAAEPVPTEQAGYPYGESINLRLEPGERISQPSLLIGHFTGGRWVGHNALRRILYEQYVATLDGKKPLPPVSWNHWFTFRNSINEKNAIELTDSVAGLGMEYFCIDAGWYNVDFPQGGDWRVNPNKFPRGLEPVSESIRSKGMSMGLWFDPERVTPQAYDAFPHKEFLRPVSRDPVWVHDRMEKVWIVNLADPDARRWMIDLIGGYVRKLNLGWIRWDMNYGPIGIWRLADEENPERRGMAEIRYVEGLYEVMDAVRRNHPNLVIEWCAGGGHRIDLETIRRSHTFWKSDLTGDGDMSRPHLSAANLFLPGNYLNSNLIKLDSLYDYHCQFGGPLGFGHDFRGAGNEYTAEAKRAIASYKELRRFLVEDYYPLFDHTTDPRRWDGWQFHDPRQDEGFFLVFRPVESARERGAIRLRGIGAKRTYILDAAPESGLPKSASGGRLLGGLPVEMKSPRGTLLVRYRAKTADGLR